MSLALALSIHNKQQKSLTIICNLVYGRHVTPSAFTFSLSSHRHFYMFSVYLSLYSFTINKFMPNTDPINIDLLRGKHPEPPHPDSDPVRLSSIFWPRPQNLEEYWSSNVGTEFLDKWFTIPKICQYFHTHSPPLPYWFLPPIFY